MEKVAQLIEKMTLEEKAALCSGADFWHLKDIKRLGIPSIMMADGPHGLRKQREDQGDHLGIGQSLPATCFPTAATTANSWDRDLLHQIGSAIAEEALQEGVAVVLGPGANIKRSPLCGRNFEYISEDPYLTGELSAAIINSMQSQGVGASLKHFAVNNQETRRMVVDAVVDERALREIYLAGFETAVKQAQPWTVMGAYNRVNGTYACENARLLTEILRDEWGFSGLVVTDWGACNDRVAGLQAGLDLEMPSSGGVNDALIVEAVRRGELEEKVLDRTLARLLTLIFDSEANKKPGFRYDRKAHHDLAQRAAAESIVLLKNEDHVLPLRKGQRIALLGEFARHPRYQGAGSSLINPTKLTNVHDELTERGIDFVYAPGYSLKNDQPDDKLIAEARKAAENADTVIIMAGLPATYESEGYDRTHMQMPQSHNELIRQAAAVNPNVIVVLCGGSPVEMPWIDNVKGLLHAYLPGQAGAGAIAEVLYGVVNPSGKLAETYPFKLSDTPTYHSFAEGRVTAEYSESIYVGYRYYDTAHKDVLFPFGYGLSYTTFAYSDLALSNTVITDKELLKVSVKVKNVGSLAGAEVVQLYVRDDDSTVFRPEKELKGFAKVFLHPGDERTVQFELSKRAFAYYNTAIGDWHVEEGEFTILVGASSRDIRLKSTIMLRSAQQDVAIPDYRTLAPNYYPSLKGFLDRDQFRVLYGRELPEDQIPVRPNFTLNSSLDDIKDTTIGKIFLRISQKVIRQMIQVEDEDDPNYKMVLATYKESPLRSLVLMSGGLVSMELMEGIVHFANGKRLAGAGAMRRALVNSLKRRRQSRKEEMAQ